MLVGGVEAADHAWRMEGLGVAGDAHLEWPGLAAFKRSFTDPVPEKREQAFADNGIDRFHGCARFTGPNTVDIEGEVIEAGHVLIACGAEAIPLGIAGEEHLITNEGFLDLQRLPQRIVLVGGGYIAAEFSHIAARVGAKVTIFQRGDRMLERFDPDLVAWLMDKFRALGIDVHTGADVTRIEKTGDGFRVHAKGENGNMAVEADIVVHAAGRAPALAALDLNAAGVAAKDGRLVLNEFLQSVSNPSVYAAGDAAEKGPPLTPVSSHDAKVVAANLLEGNRHAPDYTGVPSVAFTIPPIAAVGLTEAAAREAGMAFRLNSDRVDGWFTARQQAETVYGFKILMEEDSDRILGAHLAGPHVDEIINLFALAIRHDLTASQLKATMFAYPTGASDISGML